MSIWLDVVYFFGFLLYLPIMLLRGKWHGGFRCRFALFSPEMVSQLASGRNIWIHAVSVGEVMAIESLIRGLRSDYPECRVILSVTTKTGYALAGRNLSDKVLLLWAPLDFGWVVRRFVKILRPVLYIAVETELWPNLFRCLSERGIPIVIVNGRVSDEAFSRYRLLRSFLRGALGRVSLFAMQSQVDADRVVCLGADRSVVKVMGNVKFDNVPNNVRALRSDLGLDEGHLVFVGGSTHPGEEEVLLDAFGVLRREYPSLRLVLAPRHCERASRILALVRKKGFNPVLFSTNKEILRPEDVLVVDTIGHLMEFYAVATVVFVGKTLLAKGGHNIIEPAVFGKPIIIGPHVQNFRDIVRAFVLEKAVVQIRDAFELQGAVKDLLANERLRGDIGARALAVVHNNRGATERTLKLVGTLWKQSFLESPRR